MIADISDTDAAYIAGIIDADGMVSATRRHSKKSGAPTPLPTPLVIVTNSDLSLIKWLSLKIGAGCAYEVKTRPVRPDQNDAHWNKVHRYQITGWKALSLVGRIRPFMRVKGRQADLVCEIAVRGKEFSAVASDEQRRRSFWALAELRALNQRGKKDTYQHQLAV